MSKAHKFLISLLIPSLLSIVTSSCMLKTQTKCKKFCYEGLSLLYSPAQVSLKMNMSPVELKIINQTDEAIETCSIEPSLPDGLVLNSDCQITGKPIQLSSAKTYLVTAKSKNYKLQAQITIDVFDQDLSEFDHHFYYQSGFLVNENLARSKDELISGCRIVPKLPAGYVINDSCRIYGITSDSFNDRAYKLSFDKNQKNVRLNIAIRISGRNSNSVLQSIDARDLVTAGIITPDSDCGSLVNRIGFRDSIFFDSLFDISKSCNSRISTIGNGLLEDPYKFFGNGNFSFYSSRDLHLNSKTEGVSNTFYFKLSENHFYESGSSDLSQSYFKVSIENRDQPCVAFANLKVSVFGYQETNQISVQSCSGVVTYYSFNARLVSNSWNQVVFSLKSNNELHLYINGEFVQKIVFNLPLPMEKIKVDLNYRNIEFGFWSVENKNYESFEVKEQCLSFRNNIFGQLQCEQTNYHVFFQGTGPIHLQDEECLPVPWELRDHFFRKLATFPEHAQQFDQDGFLVFDLSLTGSVNSETYTAGIGKIYSLPSCSAESEITQLKIKNQLNGSIYIKTQDANKMDSIFNHHIRIQEKHKPVFSNPDLEFDHYEYFANAPQPNHLSFWSSTDCGGTPYIGFFVTNRYLSGNVRIFETFQFKITDLSNANNSAIVTQDSSQPYASHMLTRSAFPWIADGKSYKIEVLSPSKWSGIINSNLPNSGQFTTSGSESCGD